MKKKLISLVLLAGLLLSSLAGCSGEKTSEESDEEALEQASANTMTITLTAITGKSTTEDAIAQVQKAMNRLTKSEYKTQVILQLKTEDEYVDYIESQVAEIEARIEAEEAAAKLAKEEAKKRKEAEKAARANEKKRTKWTTTTKGETSETEETQEMTQDEYGRPVAKYPALEGATLDILFITGIDMFQDFMEKDYLADVSEELTNSAKILKKYIYPTLLEAGQDSSSTYAILNNRIMGEYTYLLVDKTLAAKYSFDADAYKTFPDLEEFLDNVKANEPDYVPLNEAPELAYLQYCGYEGSAIGSVVRANYLAKTKSVPKKLVLTDTYVYHEAFLDKLEKGGYIGSGDKYAVEVRKGYITTPDEENWEDNYKVIVYEKPICTNDMYEGMFAVSAYARDVERCMEIVTMLNTNAELHNIYTYGIEGVNYKLNDDGTVHMLNNDWSMNFYHTGNTFIGAVPETLPANYAEIGKLQNIETVVSPYFRWQYENEDTESLLKLFKPASDALMAEFEKQTDKVAYYEALKAAEQKAKDDAKAAETAAIEAGIKYVAPEITPESDILAFLLNADEGDGFVGSYVDFNESTYPAEE